MYKFAGLLARAKEMREVIRINPNNYTLGLCWVLCRGDGGSGAAATAIRLEDIFRVWPEFSQLVAFPVPAPVDWHVGQNKYARAKAAYDMLPRYTGEYGQARIRLLDFIISELEKEEAAYHETTNRNHFA